MKLFQKWDLVRIIRFSIGVLFALIALFSSEYLFLLPAAVLVLQALLNLSCCGVSGCSVPEENQNEPDLRRDIKEYKK